MVYDLIDICMKVLMILDICNDLSIKRQKLTELETCSIQKLLDDYSQWGKFQQSTELVSLNDISILSFSLYCGKDLRRALISCATQP